MKEKRYYCDWALSKSDKGEKRLFKKVLLISLIAVTVISSVIYYSIIRHNHSEDLEAYSESAYEYLDEIADNVITKDGINMSAIPKDVVEYEITYKDGEIIFKYNLDNNKGKDLATSANMTVTLSEDFEILNKEPNFSSKEEYVTSHKIIYVFVPLLGACTWAVLDVISCIIMAVAIPISMIHKKMNMKKNLL